MDYLPIVRQAQHQMLEDLLPAILQGVLLSMAVAVAFLVCLFVSDLRLPPRRPSEPKETERSLSGELGPEPGRKTPERGRTLHRSAAVRASCSGGHPAARTEDALLPPASQAGRADDGSNGRIRRPEL